MSACSSLNQKLTLLLFLAASVLVSCEKEPAGELLLIEKDPGKGFNFPYYLFIPDQLSDSSEKYLIVEPNNTGIATDDFQLHLEKAGRTASKDFYLGNYLAANLKFPLVVPVFPRSKITGNMYTHSLDRDVMLQKGNELERPDLQLLQMIADARQKLRERGIETKPEILMTGFSASGTFANRFSLIHPDRVKAVAAGGLNGILMLPLSEEKGYELNFPAGTNDFETLFGKAFDSTAFKNTPQLLFMGALDENDALPYDDAYDPGEREAITAVLGAQMLPERWNNSRKLYAREGVKAQVKTFLNIGHEHPEQVKQEILGFFRRSLEEKEAGSAGLSD